MTNVLLIFGVTFVWVNFVGAGRNGDLIYKGGFSEDVWSCEDFQNDVMIANLKLEMVSDEKGDDALGLKGVFEINEDIQNGAEMDVKVWKFMEIGKEFVYNSRGDICSSLDNEETPWYPLLSKMNITSCPIFKGIYKIDDLTVNLSFAQDIMCHEFCGEYSIAMAVVEPLDELTSKQICCYELQVTIYEETVDDENK